MTPAGGENDPVVDLLELIERRRPQLSSRPDLVSRAVAAAGLARAAALLDGARRLARSGRVDVYGVFTRPVWECWLLATYVLLGGQRAMDEIRGVFAKYWGSVTDRLPDAPVIDSSGLPQNRIVWEQLERKVGDLLAARGVDVERSTYDSLYRHESTMDSHAGWGSFARYLERSDDGRWLVDSVGQLSLPLDEHEAITALFVCDLAALVYDAFGMSTNELRDLHDRLEAMALADYPDDASRWGERAYPTARTNVG